MLIKPNIIKVRQDDGTFSELQNLMVGEQDIVPAKKVEGLSKVAISGHYKDLEGAPDPKDLIIDAGIEVGNEEPERTSIDVWIDTNQGQTTYRIPEVKDNLINEQDTWSSKKIDTFVRTSGSGIYMHDNPPTDENINLWLDTELSDDESIRIPEINDEIVSLDDTWSSSKIRSEIAANASGVQDLSTLFNLIYPIGSIYTSANPTNPSVLFGGVWVQIKDTFLLTAGDTYIAGAVGGEAEHTLTTEEMPNFYLPLKVLDNKYYAVQWAKIYGNSYNNYAYTVADSEQPVAYRAYVEHTGGDKPHNNMPPYLVVYAWQRTE